MSRCKAVEWLFWHHFRERWERAELKFFGRVVTAYPQPKPTPDGFWTRRVLG